MYLHGARLQISLLLLMLLSRLNPSRVHWPSTTTGEETTTAGETAKKRKKKKININRRKRVAWSAFP